MYVCVYACMCVCMYVCVCVCVYVCVCVCMWVMYGMHTTYGWRLCVLCGILCTYMGRCVRTVGALLSGCAVWVLGCVTEWVGAVCGKRLCNED